MLFLCNEHFQEGVKVVIAENAVASLLVSKVGRLPGAYVWLWESRLMHKLYVRTHNIQSVLHHKALTSEHQDYSIEQCITCSSSGQGWSSHLPQFYTVLAEK